MKLSKEERKAKVRKHTKKIIHIFFKFFLIFLIFFMVTNILVFVILNIYHHNQLDKEKQYLVQTGKQVEVNGHYMNVVTGGKEDAKYTYVFMHSARIVDDSVALQPLWKEMRDDCRFAYVDRSGVGFSDVSGESREIDVMNDETRKALLGAGVKPPYILVPMGTAGIEALHWANKYPDEVIGIFGIGMSYPEQYEGMKTIDYCGFTDWLMVRFFKVGGSRLVSSLKPEDLAGIYTNDQMETRKALIYKGAYTDDMYEEDLAMVDNAAKVQKEGWPKDIPITVLYGNPVMEPYIKLDKEKQETIKKAQETRPDLDYAEVYNYDLREFYKDKKNVTFEELSGPSRVYTFDPKGVKEKLVEFGKNVESKQK